MAILGDIGLGRGMGLIPMRSVSARPAMVVAAPAMQATAPLASVMPLAPPPAAPLVQATMAPALTPSQIAMDPVRSVMAANLDKGTSLLLIRAKEEAAAVNEIAAPSLSVLTPVRSVTAAPIVSSSSSGVDLPARKIVPVSSSGGGGGASRSVAQAWKEDWSAGSSTSAPDEPAGEVEPFVSDAIPSGDAQAPGKFPILPVALVGLVLVGLFLRSRR